MRQFGSKLFTALSQFDWVLIGAASFLIGVGLVMQYSIGINQDIPDLGQFNKQAIFVLIGAACFIALTMIDNRQYRAHPAIYVAIAAVLLGGVLLFGQTIKGTTGWFVIAGVSVQPVEFVKIMVILFFATYLTKGVQHVQEPKYFLTTAGVVVALVGLIVLQPDLGSAAVVFAIWYGMLIVLRVPKWIVAITTVLVIVASIFAWFFVLDTYAQNRLTTFINPEADSLNTGYNITQSIVAVGSGGMWGRGLGLGTQSQLHFLPEVNSDFIFAAISEELGLFGATAIILAISILLYRLWRIAQSSKDSFSIVLVIGVLIYIAFQSVITIGMNIGVLPVTGLPLPLVSAGGTSMIATLILLGAAHRIHMTNS